MSSNPLTKTVQNDKDENAPLSDFPALMFLTFMLMMMKNLLFRFNHSNDFFASLF